MAKFIMSIGDNAYDVLANEAKNRDVTVQQLLRAVVVPDWIKQNADGQPTGENPNLIQSSVYGGDSRNSRMLVSPVARLRRSEEHTSELQSLRHLVCRLLLEKKKTDIKNWP